jgi:uncharacterized protein
MSSLLEIARSVISAAVLLTGYVGLLPSLSAFQQAQKNETPDQKPADRYESIRRSAEQGDAIAQGKLGLMYEEGQGIPKDYTEAVRWYRRAAEQGDAIAQTKLGLMYEEGKGVPKDYAEAVRWYRRAAEQGDATAEFNLGLIYENGKGVSRRDYVEAVRWYRKAAEQGIAQAETNLGLIYAHDAFINDFGQPETPDPDGRVPTDYAEAIRWFRKAAEQGNAKAQFSLASKYHLGEEVTQDYGEAIRWYRKAAEQREPLAEFNLGVMYAKGQGVPQDYVQGYAWISLGAADSRGDAQKEFYAKEFAADRDRLAKEMTAQQLAQAQRFIRQWEAARP